MLKKTRSVMNSVSNETILIFLRLLRFEPLCLTNCLIQSASTPLHKFGHSFNTGVTKLPASWFHWLCFFKVCQVSNTLKSESQNAVIVFCYDSKGIFTCFQDCCHEDITVVAESSSTTLLFHSCGTSASFKGIELLKQDKQTQEFWGMKNKSVI